MTFSFVVCLARGGEGSNKSAAKKESNHGH
jgi:hypothetical protein